MTCHSANSAHFARALGTRSVTWPQDDAEAVQFTDSSGRPVHHRHRSFAIHNELCSARRPRLHHAPHRRSVSLTPRSAVEKSKRCGTCNCAKLCLLNLNVSSTFLRRGIIISRRRSSCSTVSRFVSCECRQSHFAAIIEHRRPISLRCVVATSGPSAHRRAP